MRSRSSAASAGLRPAGRHRHLEVPPGGHGGDVEARVGVIVDRVHRDPALLRLPVDLAGRVPVPNGGERQEAARQVPAAGSAAAPGGSVPPPASRSRAGIASGLTTVHPRAGIEERDRLPHRPAPRRPRPGRAVRRASGTRGRVGSCRYRSIVFKSFSIRKYQRTSIGGSVLGSGPLRALRIRSSRRREALNVPRWIGGTRRGERGLRERGRAPPLQVHRVSQPRRIWDRAIFILRPNQLIVGDPAAAGQAVCRFLGPPSASRARRSGRSSMG